MDVFVLPPVWCSVYLVYLLVGVCPALAILRVVFAYMYF